MLRACKPSNISRATGNVVSSVRPTTRCCPNSSAYNRVSFSVQSTSRTFRPRIGCTPTSHWRITAPCVGSIVVGCAWSMWAPSLNLTTTTSCEVARVEESSINEKSLSIRVRSVDDRNKKSVWATTKRAIRLIKRMLKLTIALSPIVILYPLQYLLTAILSLPATKEDKRQDAHQVALASSLEVPDGPLGWYYKVCLHCVEWSGAAAIKLMQWAGSRPDMFGQSFCAVFSQLQDDTTPHAWKHTERALRQAYGEDWQEHIRLDEILGSGCIAQVYKGVICDDNGKEQHVAVKVMHPNVEDDIDSDLDLMRLATHILEWMPFDLLRDVKWLNLPGIVEEMATLLKIQLDLRTEADHLVRFNENFKDNDMIIFPKLVNGYEPTKAVLIETFCPGEPIMDFIRNNKEAQSVLHEMCKGAIRAVCQMIFLDNFIHGDLHPGNVLVTNDLKFVLLDVGIVVENNERDHRLISDVLAAFIRMDGRAAGQRMIEDSNARLLGHGEHAVNEEQFLNKIEGLTIKASGKNYFMEHLGSYITTICNAAAKHHIMLNQAFVSAALAVKVQEGIALALDPSVQIWRIAIPIILEGERRNGYVTDRAKEMIGFERILEWLRGTRGTSHTSTDSSTENAQGPSQA